jgi:hypothetical protein
MSRVNLFIDSNLDTFQCLDRIEQSINRDCLLSLAALLSLSAVAPSFLHLSRFLAMKVRCWVVQYCLD